MDKVELAEYSNGKKLILTTETPSGINAQQLAQAAEDIKTLYDVWVEAWFSKQQALELVKTMVAAAAGAGCK